MNKTQKKLDKKLVKALTQACEYIKSFVHGFEWLTHSVNYNDFPASLHITCVFDTDDSMARARVEQLTAKMIGVIDDDLDAIGVRFKKTDQHVTFDSEQACQREHGGNWQRRLSIH